MLTTRPYLTTFRPSPTTVQFTVSTTLRPQTLASHASHVLLLAIRIVLGFLTVFVLVAKYLGSAPAFPTFLSDSLGAVTWVYIVPISIAILFLVLRRFQTGIHPVFYLP